MFYVAHPYNFFNNDLTSNGSVCSEPIVYICQIITWNIDFGSIKKSNNERKCL